MQEPQHRIKKQWSPVRAAKVKEFFERTECQPAHSHKHIYTPIPNQRGGLFVQETSAKIKTVGH